MRKLKRVKESEPLEKSEERLEEKEKETDIARLHGFLQNQNDFVLVGNVVHDLGAAGRGFHLRESLKKKRKK